LFWWCGLSGAAAQPVLEAVDIANLPGGQVQLRFQLSGAVDEPRSFTINDPARLVLDFDGVSSGLSVSQQTINQGAVQRVTVLEGNDRTRAAINLSRVVPYTIRRQGNNILLTMDAGGSAVVSRPAPSRSSTAPVTATPQLGTIDFRRGSSGEGLIEISLSNPNITVDVRQQGEDIIADFIGAQLPRGQERRLDVTDFATPVTLIDATNTNDGVRIRVQRSGDSEFLAYQTDERYTIEVAPALQEPEQETDGPKVYTGELLSLNFQDIEVRAVLQILADFTGLNIVVSDTVQGNLTLRLQNVPWDQALDIILETKGLTQRQNGNVIYIAPTEEVAARQRIELEAEQQREQLEPLRTETIQINYAKAEDLAALISEGSGDEDASLLSPRGSISADPRSNNLLIQDIPSKIAQIRGLMTVLDQPVRQVQIDARIVIASDNFTRDLGVRWGFSAVRRTGNYGLASISGSALGNNAVIQQGIANLQETGQPFPVNPPEDLAERLGVNFPATGGLSGGNPARVALAILGQDFLVDLELSALQAEGEGETLSAPRVITTSNKEAVINQGTQIPFNQLDEAGNTTTEFVDALLELRVTPQVTPDGRVIMDLVVTKNEPNFAVTGVDGQPSILQREITSQVLVDDGETVVLGGVFEQITNNSVDKVPFLGDIPGLGALFRRTLREDNQLELLIFVTPQIINPGNLAVQ
jgi:type IV pilus assembly protein PilQ